MTIERVIALAGLMEPGNVLPEELAIAFLSELDGMIQSDIMLLAPEEIVTYDNTGQELMLKPPHDSIYVTYLVAMIRQVQQEFEGYNNAQAAVNEKLAVFRRWFISRYRPADQLGLSYTGTSTGVQGVAYLSAYGIAVKLGFRGTEAEWLESLKGDKGDTGAAALLRYDPETGFIQWQSAGEESWTDLVQVGSLLEEAVADAVSRAERAADEAGNHAMNAANHAKAAAQSAREASDAADRAEGAAGGFASTEYVNQELEKLWAEINYVPIKINIFKRTPSVVVLGTVLDSVALTWTLNTNPATQRMNGTILLSAVRSVDQPGPFTKTTDFTLTVTDERDAVDTATVKVHFYNHVYYGVRSGRAMPPDGELYQMPSALQDSLGLNINAAAGDGEYVLYASPSRLGTPEFWANGFQGGFEKLGTMLHANEAGYTENYDIWLSNAAGLNLTITVK